MPDYVEQDQAMHDEFQREKLEKRVERLEAELERCYADKERVQTDADELDEQVERLERVFAETERRRRRAECLTQTQAWKAEIEAVQATAEEDLEDWDVMLTKCQKKLAAAEARERELRDVCNQAMEWAGGFPLGGETEDMDAIAAHEVYQAYDAVLGPQPKQDALDAYVEARIAELRDERDMLSMAMIDYRAEAEHQERERAAAEAGRRKCKDLLKQLEWDLGNRCPVCGYTQCDGYRDSCELVWALETESHAALDAALDQHAVHILGLVEQAIDEFEGEYPSADTDTGEAFYETLAAHHHQIAKVTEEVTRCGCRLAALNDRLDEWRGEEERHESGDTCISCQMRVATKRGYPWCTICLLEHQLAMCNQSYEGDIEQARDEGYRRGQDEASCEWAASNGRRNGYKLGVAEERERWMRIVSDLLMSADAIWEELRLGHDWPQACERARQAIRNADQEATDG